MIAKSVFIEKVSQLMNEHSDGTLIILSGSDDVQLKYHIENVIKDAWRKAVKALPSAYFNCTDFSDSPLYPFFDPSTQSVDPKTENGVGYVVLPDDFYTLYSFKMKGWNNRCVKTIPFSDPVALRQDNGYVRGTAVRPVCVLGEKVIEGNMKKTLTYYSVKKGLPHKIEEALYLKLLQTDGVEIDITEQLFIPLAYIAAGIVCNIFEKPQAAVFFEQKLQEIL